MDIQALGVAGAAILTALASIIGGIYAGRNVSKKDDQQADLLMEQAQHEREMAVEAASRTRVQDLSDDIQTYRARIRELEDEMSRRNKEAQKAEQHWRELASNHYNTLVYVVHLLNNIFTLVEIDAPIERWAKMVRATYERFKLVAIPVELEDKPINNAVRLLGPNPTFSQDVTTNGNS